MLRVNWIELNEVYRRSEDACRSVNGYRRRRRMMRMKVRRKSMLSEPAEQPVGTGLTFGTLISCQQVHVGHGRALVAHWLQRSVTLAGLANANEDGRQWEDGFQCTERHEDGVDDDRALPQRNSSQKFHRISVLDQFAENEIGGN